MNPAREYWTLRKVLNAYLPWLSWMFPRPLCLAKDFKKFKEKTCYTEMSPSRRFTKIMRAKALALCGDAERAGLVQAEEEMALKEPCCSPCAYGEGVEEMEMSSLL